MESLSPSPPPPHLGPCLANIFMNYYEKIWLDECSDDIKPKFYRRYVDDIFILYVSQEKNWKI